MDTAELIDLVTANHKEVLAKHEKTLKATEDIPGLKAQMVNLEQKMVRRQGGGPLQEETKTWGQTIVDSDQFKAFREGGGRGQARIEIKTVNTIGSGSTLAGPMIAPHVITDPTILPRRKMTIRNLLAPGTTGGNSVWFPRMTLRQNNAAPVAESAQKPKSDVRFTQIQTPVVTIAHFMQVARQAMDDAPSLQALVDSELRYGLALTEETQLIAGDGTGQNLLGLIPQATAYSGAFAITGETAIDRVALAILQAELSLLPANGVVLNPTDWMKMKLTKDGMGKYILGEPGDAASPTLWGLPVISTPAITAGNMLVGAFDAAAQIFDRLSVEVLISSENQNNFEINELTVRCEERLALAVKQPLGLIFGSLP
jgi:HK97 family phage major capsid protein